MVCGPAQALALGRTTVISALGEPLHAEIDIPDIQPDEVASLQAAPAAAEAFRAAGLEFNTYVNSIQVKLAKRADGRPYLQLSSDRPVTDPYLDLFLTVQWATGRITRDYTLLFDPPALRRPVAPPLPVSVGVAPSPDSGRNAQARTSTPVAPAAPRSPAAPAPATAGSSNTKAPTAATVMPATSPAARQLLVKSGDTAGRIAAAIKPAHINLDQMLQALLRSNPEAFIDGNLNRLRAGAVLQLPEDARLDPQSAPQADTTLQARSQHFDRFRNKLSEQAPLVESDASSRKSSGRIQAQVEEKKPLNPTPDKLKLTSESNTRALASDQLAQDAKARETAQRMAELQRNIEELKRLTASLQAPAGGPDKASPAAAAPASAAPAAAAAPVQAVKPAPIAPAAPSPSPLAVAAKAPPPPNPVATPAPADVGAWDELLGNPMLPAAGAGLLTVLGVLGFQRLRQRRHQHSLVDSSFTSSHLQADSFFGGSGGQHIDTNETQTGGSSLAYSPSQLDAVGDVDPVAEADVYLAYGRDLQAEEILKEARRVHRTRLAIHAKLAEIYAKRHDDKALAQLASDAYEISEGEGPEWENIAALGRELDPNNPLYQLSSHIGESPALSETVRGELESAPMDLPQPGVADLSAPISLMDIDLNLPRQHSNDFIAHDEPAQAQAPAQDAVAPVASGALEPDLSQPLNLDLDGVSTAYAEPVPPFQPSTGHLPLSLSLDSLSLDLPAAVQAAPEPEALPVHHDVDANGHEDPLSTKLSLAEEFHGIGDLDGARALVDEVLAQASGDILSRAQRQLDTMH